MNYFKTERVNEEVFIMKRCLPYTASLSTQKIEQKVERIERIKIKKECEEKGMIYDTSTNNCREKIIKRKNVGIFILSTMIISLL